jgi:hypothetical protein
MSSDIVSSWLLTSSGCFDRNRALDVLPAPDQCSGTRAAEERDA